MGLFRTTGRGTGKMTNAGLQPMPILSLSRLHHRSKHQSTFLVICSSTLIFHSIITQSMILPSEESQFEILKDCLSTSVIQRFVPSSGKKSKPRKVKGRKNEIKPVAAERQPNREDDPKDASELADFVEVGSVASHFNSKSLC